MLPKLLHEAAVQMLQPAAAHALKVQVLEAVPLLPGVLIYRLLAHEIRVLDHRLLAAELVQIAVDRGAVGFNAHVAEMLSDIRHAHRQ